MPREQLQNLVMVLLIACAAGELIHALLRRRGVHSYRDTVSSVALGVGQQAINIYLSAGFLAAYVAIAETMSFATADMGVWWHWVLLILACDFCYYVGHRAGHTVNFWVAAHIVHHHAEDFNLLSALRQSWTAWIVMFPFFLPLAFCGVPLDMFVYGQMGIMFFQFTSHASAQRLRLGVLDALLITPANHRVHHGYNRRYWGRNAGGMFVIWDRVFGTYAREDPEDPVKLGAGIDFNFYDPFEANFDYYKRVWFVCRRRQGLWNKIAIWWQSPDVLQRELNRLGYISPTAPVERHGLTPRDKRRVAAVLGVAVACLWLHRLLYANHPLAVNLATGACVFGCLFAVGRLLSGHRREACDARGTSDVTLKLDAERPVAAALPE